MKLKATYKEIKQSNSKIIRLGYCEVQTLLRYHEPFAYSCGVYGWNCDYYQIDNTIICTGYRPIGNLSIKYDDIREYEKKAEKIVYTAFFSGLSYEDQVKQVNDLLLEMIEEAI